MYNKILGEETQLKKPDSQISTLATRINPNLVRTVTHNGTCNFSTWELQGGKSEASLDHTTGHCSQTKTRNKTPTGKKGFVLSEFFSVGHFIKV